MLPHAERQEQSPECTCVALHLVMQHSIPQCINPFYVNQWKKGLIMATSDSNIIAANALPTHRACALTPDLESPLLLTQYTKHMKTIKSITSRTQCQKFTVQAGPVIVQSNRVWYKFVRKLHIKRHFLKDPITKEMHGGNLDIRHSGLAKALVFNSPGNLPSSLAVFRDLVAKDLKDVQFRSIKENNIN